MAFCLSPQALASTSAAPPATSYAAVLDAAFQPGHTPTPVLDAAGHQLDSARPAWYTVRADDSLSTIAKRFYHNPSAWPVLYWANRSHIHWANVIEAGQKLRIPVEPSRIPAAPSLLGPTAPAAPSAAGTPAGAAPAMADSTYSGSAPGGSFAACVIARESGGQTQVMNSSGHYGLYQFSASTWAEYGGSPADFGHASAAEQNQVFGTALASGGQSNWSAYDGC